MKLSRTTVAFSVVTFFILLSSFISCQKETESQQSLSMTKPRLEGLKEFHEVLYPVWHMAYPNKDYPAIREAVADFKTKMEIIQKAELPGFFREKKEDFEKKRDALAKAVLVLEQKAKGSDNGVLLKATENLHTAFEQLARVFAPRVKELEDFHLVLYPIWHQALPSRDFNSIITSAPAFQEKMEILMRVELTDRFKEIEPQFLEKREVLKASVYELVEACKQRDNKKIEQKLDIMHTAYMELDKVFE